MSIEKFNLKNLSEVEIKERNWVKISKQIRMFK
jgi:hypothetical protein